MSIHSTVSRRQRLLRAVLLAISLTAFSYPFLNTIPEEPNVGLWHGFGAVCALASVAALVWSIRVFRSPDDHLRCWEPDPRSNPETRGRRFAAFSLLAVVGVVAFAGAFGGFGFEGAVWWRSLLFSIGWPTLLSGLIGLVLVSREGHARAAPGHASSSPR